MGPSQSSLSWSPAALLGTRLTAGIVTLPWAPVLVDVGWAGRGRTLHRELSGEAVGGITEQVPRETDICLAGREGPKGSLPRAPAPQLRLLSLGVRCPARSPLNSPALWVLGSPPCGCLPRTPGAHQRDRRPLLQVVRSYKAAIQQTLDILFLQEGSEFLSSTDASSRDSADRTIIAWDFRSSAKISNQIFHVRQPVWHCFQVQPRTRPRSPRLSGSQVTSCGRRFSRQALGRRLSA